MKNTSMKNRGIVWTMEYYSLIMNNVFKTKANSKPVLYLGHESISLTGWPIPVKTGWHYMHVYISWCPLKYRGYLLSFKERCHNDSQNFINYLKIEMPLDLSKACNYHDEHTILSLNRINPILLMLIVFQTPKQLKGFTIH